MKKDCLLASTLAFNRVGSLGWPQQTTKPKLKPGQRMITLQHESDQKLAVLLSLDSVMDHACAVHLVEGLSKITIA